MSPTASSMGCCAMPLRYKCGWTSQRHRHGPRSPTQRTVSWHCLAGAGHRVPQDRGAGHPSISFQCLSATTGFCCRVRGAGKPHGLADKEVLIPLRKGLGYISGWPPLTWRGVLGQCGGQAARPARRQSHCHRDTCAARVPIALWIFTPHRSSFPIIGTIFRLISRPQAI